MGLLEKLRIRLSSASTGFELGLWLLELDEMDTYDIKAYLINAAIFRTTTRLTNTYKRIKHTVDVPKNQLKDEL